MSDLSRPKEAAEWVAAWRQAVRLGECSARRGKQRLADALATMRSEVAGCEMTGRWPSAWRPDDVRASVRILEQAQQDAA